MLSTIRNGRRVRLRAEDGHPPTFFVGDRIPVSFAQYSSQPHQRAEYSRRGGSNFPISTLATGASPISVATGILRSSTTANPNPSLFQDLIVANNGDNTVSVFLGNGDGTFGMNTDFTTGNGPSSIATGNFNADAISTWW